MAGDKKERSPLLVLLLQMSQPCFCLRVHGHSGSGTSRTDLFDGVGGEIAINLSHDSLPLGRGEIRKGSAKILYGDLHTARRN